MSTSTSSKEGPHVEHSFDGEVRILHATFDRRLEIRKALVALAQELQRIEGHPVQIKADIQLNIGGAAAKHHLYAVTVADPAFDVDEELSRPSPSRETRAFQPAAAAPSANVSTETYHNDTRRPSLDRPLSSGSTRQHQGPTDDPIDLRPCKRPRSTLSHTPDLHTLTASKLDELLTYIKAWHSEWTSQGGWLFDTLTKTNPAQLNEQQLQIERKLDTVQDVLGQSLNSASAAAMTELDNISKLVPWLEHCRKTNADKVQAREEKWRTSSANFHDEARRDRERAEKRIEDVVAEQGVLLARIARMVGVEVEGRVDVGVGSGGRSPEVTREGPLGAQLRRELSFDPTRSAEGMPWSKPSAVGNEAIAVD